MASKPRSMASEDWAEAVRLLHNAGTRVEILVESFRVGGMRWWGVVAIVQDRDTLLLGRAREFKNERKLWRRFDAAAGFLQKELPMIDEIRVRLKEAKG